jgi:hypothetical protein
LPVSSLTLSYSVHDLSIEPLTSFELDALAAVLVARIRTAEDDIALRPPPARPAPEMCRLCSVRHLCEDYWAGFGATGSGEFVDREGSIVGRNGPRSWMIEIQGPRRERVLLRTPSETPGFDVGDDVRLLDVALAEDEEVGLTVLTLTRASEVFRLVPGR